MAFSDQDTMDPDDYPDYLSDKRIRKIGTRTIDDVLDEVELDDSDDYSLATSAKKAIGDLQHEVPSISTPPKDIDANQQLQEANPKDDMAFLQDPG